MSKTALAPELITSKWLNSPAPLSLEKLRGKVVMVEAFQMLCPGCVSHGLPQAQKVYATFKREDVEVIGLHTVFEHHAAQGTPEALEAFLHEYRIPFPVAIDQPSSTNSIPKTMETYQLGGTPSILLIDRQGRLKLNHFGNISDIALGAQIMELILEKPSATADTPPVSAQAEPSQKEEQGDSNCDDQGCKIN